MTRTPEHTIPQSQLLFIPGLGDRAWLCRLAAPLWCAFGYQTHVYCFGWQGSAELLPERQQRLEAFERALPPGPLSVIGMSAGGVAAVNLLAAVPSIRRVMTIASPLLPQYRPTVPLLAAAMSQAQAHFAAGGTEFAGKIVTAYGFYDRVVPPAQSRRAYVRPIGLPTIGHGPTIALALTVFALRLRKSLK